MYYSAVPNYEVTAIFQFTQQVNNSNTYFQNLKHSDELHPAVYLPAVDTAYQCQQAHPNYMEVSEIHNYRSKIDIGPDQKLRIKHISLLVVAPGLPFIKPLDSADWFNDDDYHPVDGDVPLRPKKGGHDLRPHPINEGCYIIDILATRG